MFKISSSKEKILEKKGILKMGRFWPRSRRLFAAGDEGPEAQSRCIFESRGDRPACFYRAHRRTNTHKTQQAEKNHFENKKTMKKKGVGTWWCDEELIEVDEEGPAVRQHRRRPRPAVPRRQQPLEEVACYYFNHRARARAEGRKLSRHVKGGSS